MRKQTKSLDHVPQEAVEAECILSRRALSHNTVVLQQQEPISQILGRLKAGRHNLHTLASRGGNAPRFVATLEQLQLMMCSSLNSSHLSVTPTSPSHRVLPQLLLAPHGSKNSHSQQQHTSNKRGLSPHSKFTGNELPSDDFSNNLSKVAQQSKRYSKCVGLSRQVKITSFKTAYLFCFEAGVFY